MKESIYDLLLDVQSHGLQLSLPVKRGDSARRLRIRLTESGRSYPIGADCSAVFTAKKPDETVIYNACTIEKNAAVYSLTGQETNTAGVVVCELRLYDSGGKLLTSPSFCLLVEDTVYDDSAVTDSSSEYTALTELVSQAKEVLEEAEQWKTHAVPAYAPNGADYRGEWEGAALTEGTQILLVPQSCNTGPATLQLNGGEAYPLCLRPGWNVSGNELRPQLTLPLEAGMLLRGGEYIFRFDGAAWVLQSHLRAPRAVSGAVYVQDEAPAEAQEGAVWVEKSTARLHYRQEGQWRPVTVEAKTEIYTDGTMEQALLGEELAREDNWVGGEWSGSLETGLTHGKGAGTGALSFTLEGDTTGRLFIVSFYSSEAMTTENLTVSIGGSQPFNLYGQADPITVGILAPGNGTVDIIPSASFGGTLTKISIREVLDSYAGLYPVTDSTGETSFELRAGKGSDLDSQNGENNLFIGRCSGQMNVSGYGNAALGSEALMHNLSGFWNVALGYKALEQNTAGSRNIALGYVALRKNQVGQRNVAIGTHALREHTDGDFNIAIGADAQLEGSQGEGNIAIGTGTLYKNSGGNYNTAIGYSAMGGGTLGSRGDNNIAIGKYAAPGITGNDNICLGRQAGYNLTAGSDNVFLGVNAAKNANGAKRSLILGASSGQNVTTGSDMNVIIGNYTGNDITTGAGNITIGANLNGSGADSPRKYSSYWLNIGGLVKGYIYPDASLRYLLVDGGLELPKLPTADPKIAGRVWNDGGTLKISAGG